MKTLRRCREKNRRKNDKNLGGNFPGHEPYVLLEAPWKRRQ